MTKEQNLYVAYEWQVFYTMRMKNGKQHDCLMLSRCAKAYAADLVFSFAVNFPENHLNDVILKISHAVPTKIILAFDLNNSFVRFTAEQINEMPLPPTLAIDLDFGEGVKVLNMDFAEIAKRLEVIQ